MLWDSIDAIRAVAGPDYETAVIPEERRKYLSRYDAKSAHYEIASVQKPSFGHTFSRSELARIQNPTFFSTYAFGWLPPG
jgi:hypothetical protein